MPSALGEGVFLSTDWLPSSYLQSLESNFPTKEARSHKPLPVGSKDPLESRGYARKEAPTCAMPVPVGNGLPTCWRPWMGTDRVANDCSEPERPWAPVHSRVWAFGGTLRRVADREARTGGQGVRLAGSHPRHAACRQGAKEEPGGFTPRLLSEPWPRDNAWRVGGGSSAEGPA